VLGGQPEHVHRVRPAVVLHEHGRLAVATASNRLRLGDKIRLVPGHCDPTVNLHDLYHVVSGDTLIDIWPVDARGKR